MSHTQTPFTVVAQPHTMIVVDAYCHKVRVYLPVQIIRLLLLLLLFIFIYLFCKFSTDIHETEHQLRSRM